MLDHDDVRVRSFFWQGGEPTALPDLCDPGAAAALASATGQFAAHAEPTPGQHVLVRDALGVNKLFFAVDTSGQVHAASYWYDLRRRGLAPEAIWSVPAGHVLSIEPACHRLSLARFAQLDFAEGPFDPKGIAGHAARIRHRLGETFRAIARAAAGRALYVALSGGLDSTTIAVLARELIGPFTAVTFALREDARAPRASDDLRFAERIAAELGVPFLPVVATPDEALDLLDDALVRGQDPRDFNAHCALVNAVIGRAVAAHAGADSGSPPPMLLTGDAMNELMVDYAPVEYRGVRHYELPRLPLPALRRALVTGLEAGDREIGVFRHFGVDAIQPYSLCADAYAAIPSVFLEQPGAKAALVRAIMGSRIPSYVYDRPKTRAQCASADVPGGTLALLIDRGIDAAALRRRFCTLMGMPPPFLGRFLFGGRYRSPSTFPDPTALPH